MMIEKRKRGRPKGSSTRPPIVDHLIWQTMLRLLQWFDVKTAASITRELLGRDIEAFHRRFTRKTANPKNPLIWNCKIIEVHCSKDDDSDEMEAINVPVGRLVYRLWEDIGNKITAMEELGIWDIPLEHLNFSESTIRQVYAKLNTEFSLDQEHPCPYCGHVNHQREARREFFDPSFDPCRECGQFFG
ncbi:MAG: hypothetical protein QM769_01865 [Pseudoxanthomonas sp.]